MNQPVFLAYVASIGSYRLDGVIGKELLGYANEFLAYAELRGLSPATVRAYGYDLVSFFRWFDPRRTRRQLETVEFLKFVEFLKSRNFEPTSINRRVMSCMMFYQFIFGSTPLSIAVSKRHWNHGRASGIRLKIKIPYKLVEALEPKEVRKIMRRTKRYRDLAIMYLLLFCGLRSCEVLSLSVGDLNLLHRTIRVLGKGRKQRSLPLNDDVTHLIGLYFQYERPSDCSTDRLFVALQGKKRGTPMSKDGLRSIFRWRRRHWNLPRANAHRFRHTFGTEMARNGVKLPILQKMMGHSDPQTTMKYISLSMADVHEEYTRALTSIRSRYEPA
jgi:site-specific recombinase XerD